jgi:hypothetical protein
MILGCTGCGLPLPETHVDALRLARPERDLDVNGCPAVGNALNPIRAGHWRR